MKLPIFILIIALHFPVIFSGQNVITAETGTITFFSEAPLEDIKAENKEVKAALNTDSGELLVRLFIRDFNFRKAMMQKHFNEKYMNSEKYPKARFKGKIVDFNIENLRKNDAFPVEGELTIKGITRAINTTTTLKQEDKNLIFEADFPVELANYEVKIPKIMTKNIAEVVDVKVRLVFLKPKTSDN